MNIVLLFVKSNSDYYYLFFFLLVVVALLVREGLAGGGLAGVSGLDVIPGGLDLGRSFLGSQQSGSDRPGSGS